MIREKAGKPSAQRNLLRVLRVLLGFAVKHRMRRDNPALGIEIDAIKSDGFIPGLRRSCANTRRATRSAPRSGWHWPCCSTRRSGASDIVRLGPANMRSGRLYFTQSKTGTEMDISVAEPLAEIIAATPMVGVKTFLVTEYGQPFTPAGFGNWFRERCDEARLPHCSAHGLRKAFLRRMAEAGCTRTSSPASAATRTCAKSASMCRPPTRRAWRRGHGAKR